MNYKVVIMIATLAMTAPSPAMTETDPPVVTMDENLWVAFYDD